MPLALTKVLESANRALCELDKRLDEIKKEANENDNRINKLLSYNRILNSDMLIEKKDGTHVILKNALDTEMTIKINLTDLYDITYIERRDFANLINDITSIHST